MSEPAYEVVEREMIFMHRRAVIEISVITADLLVELAKATGMTLDRVLEDAALLFMERVQIADAIVAWGEALSGLVVADAAPPLRPATEQTTERNVKP